MASSPPDQGVPETEISLTHVFAWLSRTQQSGALTISAIAPDASSAATRGGGRSTEEDEADEGLGTVSWDVLDGNLHGVNVTGGQVEQQFLAELRAHPGVREEAVTKAQAIALEQGKPLHLVAFREKLVSIQDVARYLLRARTGLLHRLLAPGNCDVNFYEAVAEAPIRKDPVPLLLAHALVAFLKAQLADCTVAQLREPLEPWIHRFPLMRFDAALFLKGADLEFAEGMWTGNTNTVNLIERSSMSSPMAARLLLIGFAFDLLEAREGTMKVAQNRDVEEAVEQRMSAVEMGNHFDVLDVHWTTHIKDIRRKHAEEKKRLQKFLDREGLQDDLAADLKLLILAMDEALRVLTDAHQRHAYRDRLYTEKQQAYAAHFLFQQAELSVFKEDFLVAFRLLEAAIDIHPDPAYVKSLKKAHEKRAEVEQRKRAEDAARRPRPKR